jgi:hypothetical protein
MYNWWGDVEDQTFGDLIAKVIVVGLFSIPPAGILMIPSYFFINYRQRRKIIPSQSQWDQAVFVIRSAFFCHRDETCFDSDSWDHVDSYVLSVYRHFA